jgi:hypothetical protein
MSENFIQIVKEKSNEELLTMLYQFDEWDTAMLRAVETELDNRNILPADIQIRKQEIINDEDAVLTKGKAASVGGQILGWIGVLGLLGLIIGYSYTYAKAKSKYTGKTYFTYDKDTRDNGSYMFYIALTTHVLYIFYKLATAV